MTPDIVYALGALVCYGLGDIIYKRAAIAGLAAEQLLLGQAWFFCPAVLGYGWVTGTLEFSGTLGPLRWKIRGEVRHDQSSAAVFEAGVGSLKTRQDTITLALIAAF